MARIRTLKPEILEDEKTASLSDRASRLFMALILLADDHGNVRADGRWLKGQVWWAREEIAPKHAVESLLELGSLRLIATYQVNGQVYAHITNWAKHQRVDNAGKPRVPQPSDEFLNSAANLGEIPQNAALPPTSDHDLGPSRAADSPRKKSKHPLPADWQPTPEHEATARERGLDLQLQAQKFRLHAEANDRRQVSWNAAFSQWLLNSFPDRRPGESKQSEIRDIPNL